ncbi:FKBP-type peptidyl-prolyl cis-trans isomerase [Arcanobacterium pinnipediorum]|uniref:Peptidyl-prolyl cis-trans isomerase n=1 Tax=Arcanobacterium pinnipediorum TaxID=1503041 RepID=A0ABY5AIQ6_9ACTO|nr:FKBP-type peptidyl-prolyl cis-trans isomerase [Arcanobacterium pinnipediorum]USR80102.1 FKBP-type peptidyl-prolyl cis-trans isomerase [Arcanobacterium pinnipediorum]
MKRSIMAACAALVLGLSGCGADSAGEQSVDKAEVAQKSVPGTELPSVKLDGVKTRLEFPDSNPPEGLQKDVLDAGIGRDIEETDFVIANYVGQVWGQDNPFDSSFARGKPTGFSLQQVIPGWTKGLTGLKPGAKVVLSIPSDMGYGPSGGNAQAGIGPEDTIAFYVEIVDAYGARQAGDPNATVETDIASLPVEISGNLGEPITVRVKEGTPNPTEISTTVIARGSGAPVGGEGSGFYVQYALSPIDNSKSEVSYGQSGPTRFTVGAGSIFDGLKDVPVGSRVLIMAPANEQPGSENQSPGFAVVVDILGID